MNTPRPSRQRMLAGVLLSGGAAGLLLLAPTIAGAAGPVGELAGQTTPPTTEPTSEETEAAESGDRLRDLLAPLVEDGTLTAEHLDAIVEALRPASGAAVIERGPMLPPIFRDRDGGFGPGGPGHVETHRGPGEGPGMDHERRMDALADPYALDLVANTLGITAPDLLDQLGDGATVAEIATDAGRDPQEVIDVLVADAEARLAAAVQSGRLTQAVADERLESVTERVTNLVNGD